MDIFNEILQMHHRTQYDKKLRDLEYYKIVIHITRHLENPDYITKALIFLLSLSIQKTPDSQYFEGKTLSELDEEEKSCINRILRDELSLL